MAIKARETITIIKERDINATWRFYRIAPSTSAPSQPTEAQGKAYVNNKTVPSGWSVTEPAYDGTSTNSLYTCDLTSFTDGEISWSAVSKSSSYEAAKQAYNEAQNAKKVATNYMSADSRGVMVADMRTGSQQTPSTATGRNVLIDSDSVDIREGQDVLASFSDQVVIGKEGMGQLIESSDGIQLTSDNGHPVFEVGFNDYARYGGMKFDTFIITNDSPFVIELPWELGATSNLSYKFYDQNGNDVTSTLIEDPKDHTTISGNKITFDEDFCISLAAVSCKYLTVSYTAWGRFPYFTIGTRGPGRKQSFSFVAGENGVGNGATCAVFGDSNRADGINSFVAGMGNIARGHHQMVIGQYNEPIDIYSYAPPFIVGVGTSEARKNGFVINWSGVPSFRNPNGKFDTVFNLIYPVGAIYMSVNSTSPATLFGGTWERIENRFLLAAGSSYAAGATGGEATHKLTIAEMPSHTHVQNQHRHSMAEIWSDGSGSETAYKMDSSRKRSTRYTAYSTPTNQNTGGGGAHNNMPPYLAVYVWKRTA